MSHVLPHDEETTPRDHCCNVNSVDEENCSLVESASSSKKNKRKWRSAGSKFDVSNTSRKRCKPPTAGAATGAGDVNDSRDCMMHALHKMSDGVGPLAHLAHCMIPKALAIPS